MRNRYQKLGSAVASALLVSAWLLLSGCAGFNRDWAKAAGLPVPTNSLLGRWEGTWLSDANAHQGKLRCLIRQGEDGRYQGRFHAIYEKVLGFGYTVTLNVTETNGISHFRGDANLGWWVGGVYHYEGQARGTNFFSTYRCPYDHGTFQMTRPSPGAAH